MRCAPPQDHVPVAHLLHVPEQLRGQLRARPHSAPPPASSSYNSSPKSSGARPIRVWRALPSWANHRRAFHMWKSNGPKPLPPCACGPTAARGRQSWCRGPCNCRALAVRPSSRPVVYGIQQAEEPGRVGLVRVCRYDGRLRAVRLRGRAGEAAGRCWGAAVDERSSGAAGGGCRAWCTRHVSPRCWVSRSSVGGVK